MDINTQNTLILIITISLFFLTFWVYFITHADATVTYSLVMDNNTLEVFKTLNYTGVFE